MPHMRRTSAWVWPPPMRTTSATEGRGMGVMGGTLAGRRRGESGAKRGYGKRMDPYGRMAAGGRRSGGEPGAGEAVGPGEAGAFVGVAEAKGLDLVHGRGEDGEAGGVGGGVAVRGRRSGGAGRGRAAVEGAGGAREARPSPRACRGGGDPGAQADLEARLGVPDEERRARVGGEFARLGGGGVGVEGEGSGRAVGAAQDEEAGLGAVASGRGEDDVAGGARVRSVTGRPRASPRRRRGWRRGHASWAAVQRTRLRRDAFSVRALRGRVAYLGKKPGRPGTGPRGGASGSPARVTHGRSSRDSRGPCGCR
jgi:hypothetical protein